MKIHTVDQLAYAVKRAMRLGIKDQKRGHNVRTGMEIIKHLMITSYRNMHRDLLKRAYTIGRFAYTNLQVEGII
jgi:hypothetical protein